MSKKEETMTLMTEDYRDEIVAAAQIAGAKATKEHFFPRWQVNEFYKAGDVHVDMAGDKKYKVTVTDPKSKRSSSIIVSVPNARKS